MKTLSIHLRKVLIVGASTVAVMAGAAPAWADVFVVDFWGADGSIGADVFSGTLQSRRKLEHLSVEWWWRDNRDKQRRFNYNPDSIPLWRHRAFHSRH